MAEMNNIDEFLKHKTGMGGGTKRLKGWKEKGQIDVFLHTRRMPVATFVHKFPRVVNRKDKATGEPVVEVWQTDHVCHEPESVVRNQYRITDGKPDEPPQVCGLCRTIAMVRFFVVSGKIGWLDPVFRFVGDDESKAVTLLAAGLYNGFDSKKTTPEQKKEMARAKVYATEAWKQVAMAKGQYVFTLVNAADPGEGVQVLSETSLLGDKVKEAIANMRMQHGDEKGNPVLNPYAIRLFHREDEQQFDKKYAAVGMPAIPVTPEVLKLIRSEPPNIDNVTTPFNQIKARLALEKAWVHSVKLPWGKLFPGTDGAEAPPDDAPAAKTEPASKPHEVQGPSAEAPTDGGEDMVACDDCDTPMRASETVCKQCGKKYDVTPESPPPPVSFPKRSSLAGKGASEAAPAAKASPAQQGLPGAQKAPPGADPSDDDSIPF